MPLALKFAFRQLAKSPAFAFIAILLLALGIGVSTTSFSLANAALLRPLPFPDPDRLVRVYTASPKENMPVLAPGNALQLRDELRDVGQFALVMEAYSNVALAGEPAEQKTGLNVSANFLPLLGIQPAIGRGFLPDEDQPGKASVVLITDAYWREHFASDPHVIGKSLKIESGFSTIIGVLPSAFEQVRLWRRCAFVMNMTVWPGWRDIRDAKWMELVGRINPAVDPAQAQLRLLTFSAQLAHDHPKEIGSDSLRFTSLRNVAVSGGGGELLRWLIVAMAVLVLVIACANLGAVQLARIFNRQGELAIRAALGATRRNLVGIVAAESLAISTAGTALGLLLSIWTRDLIVRWLDELPMPTDFRVLGFTAGCGALAALAFGVLPAWFASGRSVNDVLKGSSRGATAERHGGKVALITVQLGLAVVLVCTAASFILGVRTFLARDRGWSPEGIVTGVFHSTWDWIQKEEKHTGGLDQVRAALAAIPGVSAVSIAARLPILGWPEDGKVFVEGADPVPRGQEPRIALVCTDAPFFSALGIKLREGRLLPGTYRRADPLVAVINATMARKFWPGQSAIGKRIRLEEKEPWREVIGVVDDVSFASGFDPVPTTLQVYRPVDEHPAPWYNVVLKSSLPAARIERSIRQAITKVDPDFTIVQIGDVPALLAQSASNGPFTPILCAFAGAGFTIALIGLYGVMSQIANHRRREIGVRLALGADYRRILALMLNQGGRLLLFGAVVGVAASYAVGIVIVRAMPELPLPGIGPRLGIAAGLGIVGLIACYLPSRRVARLNPIEVLRGD